MAVATFGVLDLSIVTDALKDVITGCPLYDELTSKDPIGITRNARTVHPSARAGSRRPDGSTLAGNDRRDAPIGHLQGQRRLYYSGGPTSGRSSGETSQRPEWCGHGAVCRGGRPADWDQGDGYLPATQQHRWKSAHQDLRCEYRGR